MQASNSHPEYGNNKTRQKWYKGDNSNKNNDKNNNDYTSHIKHLAV